MVQTIHADAVRQQLRDELLARAWAVHCLNPRRDDDDMRRQTVDWVDAAADRWWSQLGDDEPATRCRAASSLQRILWPTCAPMDEWWATPLGAALRTIRPAVPSAAATPTPIVEEVVLVARVRDGLTPPRPRRASSVDVVSSVGPCDGGHLGRCRSTTPERSAMKRTLRSHRRGHRRHAVGRPVGNHCRHAIRRHRHTHARDPRRHGRRRRRRCRRRCRTSSPARCRTSRPSPARRWPTSRSAPPAPSTVVIGPIASLAVPMSGNWTVLRPSRRLREADAHAVRERHVHRARRSGTTRSSGTPLRPRPSTSCSPTAAVRSPT